MRLAPIVTLPVGLIVLFGLLLPAGLQAQEGTPDPAAEIIDTVSSAATDRQIRQRIEAIYEEIEALGGIDVTVTAGVVTLSGTVPDTGSMAQAESLAARVEGVAAVQNALARDVSVAGRLDPATAKLEATLRDALAFLPLIGVALIVFLLFAIAGLFLAGRRAMWRRITPNDFIAGMIAAIVRIGFFLVGIVVALTILDAVALLGAFLGAAGVIGLAIGFAVKDTIENFIASIMLSLRQPFRPNDLVSIDGRLGNVVRLTSRATVLMTADGNHLRIPNALVFKAVIENYTRTPERRFTFSLGVDAEDDPQGAIDTALARLARLDFILADPPPAGWIEEVGDSNIVITLAAWIDQQHTDYLKARSQAIRAAKSVLENEGYSLPEPIYRLRIDGGGPLPPAAARGMSPGQREGSVEETRPDPAPEQPAPPPEAADTAADTTLAEKVAEDRTESGGADLLSEKAPTEFGDKGEKSF